MRNKKQAQPTPVYHQGTEAHQPSGIAPEKGLRTLKLEHLYSFITSSPLQQEQEIHWVSWEKVTELRALCGLQSRPQTVYRSSYVVRAGREERPG